MTTLKDFLSQEADKWHAQAAQRDAKRKEWIESVRRLLGEMKKWLKEADTKGVLEIEEGTISLAEASLGHYDAPALRIRLGEREVRVEPRAFRALGPPAAGGLAEGMVQITDNARRYDLYRYTNKYGEQWFMIDEDEYSTKLFDQAQFEKVVVRLFQ